MRITRAPRRSHFVMVPNDTVRDHRLPLRAVGLLVRLLSYPDGWSTDARELARTCPDGRDAIRTALSDLEAHGYLVRHRYRTASGTWASEAEVYDEPQTALWEEPEDTADQVGKSVMVLTSGNAANPQVRTRTGKPAPVGPAIRDEDGERRNPPTPPQAGGRCRRHPEGAPDGVACRACGTDRATRERQARLAASAAASAAAAARAAGRTGLGAERDPDLGSRGAAAARAASRWGRSS